MPFHNKNSWVPWNEERQTYGQRESAGFTKDLQALKEHIRKLQEVCPKDKAGWPVAQALDVLDRLKRDYETINRVFGLPPNE